MANSGKVYDVPIRVFDKFGIEFVVESDSIVNGYTGDVSIFTFRVGDLPLGEGLGSSLSNTKISWDMGDGNSYNTPEVTHSYKFPGTYNVECTIFDSDMDPHKTLRDIKVVVKDYYPTDVVWTVNSQQLTAGKPSNELTIARYNSWQHHKDTSKYMVSMYASGSKSTYIARKQFDNDKYSHFAKPALQVTNVILQ